MSLDCHRLSLYNVIDIFFQFAVVNEEEGQGELQEYNQQGEEIKVDSNVESLVQLVDCKQNLVQHRAVCPELDFHRELLTRIFIVHISEVSTLPAHAETGSRVVDLQHLGQIFWR